MSSDKIKVAVRVRPFNRREIELNTKCVVEMCAQQTILRCPNAEKSDSHKQVKNFAFDYSFWSVSEDDQTYADQQTVYQQLGINILDNAFSGYNACIFAYGQTGSGKSYTMMGNHESKGIIPRLCDALFERIATNYDDHLSYKVEVSYMEIYNEKVHDLLDPKGTKRSLRVREHNILGPYVDDLTILAVSSYLDVENIMEEGNKSRTVAATNMNSESSRSHAVFNVILTQTLVDPQSGISGEKVAKMSMVDLAGSERAVKSGALGERLKEGSNINKSLTTLGLVISKLADQSSTKSKDKFIPYRDSVLTWLLKDNLGGNSRTVMVATISPASDNYEETLSTLRYADRAKRIVNHAVINEDPNARIIRELRREVESLKEQLKCAVQREDIHEKLTESEKLMEELTQTWEEKLQKTELIHQERQQTLEKMGISVQASGIKVEQNKYYLVNLNADPSLNELLVYYLKDVTLIGKPDATVENDIQLSGLGIMPEHCEIRIDGHDLYVTPREGARTCVNGIVIVEKTVLRNGDRVLWGNNHFFRVNCPKSHNGASNIDTLTRPIDYDFAREELMMNELSNDPIQMAMKSLEKQHEEDKQGALDKQRLMYEKQLQMLRNQMSPGTPYAPYVGTDPFGMGKIMPPTPTAQMQVEQWAEERDGLFKKSLTKLREDIVKANALVREAKSLAIEMGKPTDFGVTLQIPAANLTPNRKKSAFVSEPAILVKRKGKPSQVWSLEKLENKLIDMRDMYNDYKEKESTGREGSPQKICDTFYESQENHNLIGVANVYLAVLFHDVKLVYHVPIISQQGEVAGRLHIEISRISGYMSNSYQDCDSDCSLTSSKESTSEIYDDSFQYGSQMTCRVCIRKATGLPPSLSNFVFCQYSFWGQPEVVVVPPVFNPESSDKMKISNRVTFQFDHSKEFIINVTEEFIEHCSDGALSIEVWGHQSAGFCTARSGWELDTQFLRSRSLSDRWTELTRKIELWVEIHELNEQGEYSPVEVLSRPDCLTGGVYQLRQGHQRRIQIKVKPVQNSGTLPLICESITSVAVGGIVARNKLQKALDSYQEEDLTLLREKWSDALMRRREYLDEQIQKIIHKEDKSEDDVDRERSLIDHWVCLTEERNAVLVPAPNSGIPGEPAEWNPPVGMEKHVPVLFLNLNADDMSFTNSGDRVTVAGVNSILPKEHGTKLFNLPIVKYCDKAVCAITAWDSSIHESVHLNRITSAEERVYLILKATVRLSHPAVMELILRKRLSVNIYKRQTLTDRIKKRIGRQEPLTSTAVTYEVVSNIPKALEELEDREYLAQLAASGEDSNASDGESYIEKYTRGVSAVESILTLDRLRQEVAVKELLTARGRLLRKTVSVPNISHVMRLDGPSGLLEEQFRAESIGDISCTNSDQYCRQRSNSLTGNKAQNKDTSVPNHFPLAQVSQPTKLVKPMRTLLEEQYQREVKPLLSNSQDFYNEEGDDENEIIAIQNEKSEDFAAYESYKESDKDKKLLMDLDDAAVCLMDDSQLMVKSTPQSIGSSGYSSQAVFSRSSSSEDLANTPCLNTEESGASFSNGSRDDNVRDTCVIKNEVTDDVSIEKMDCVKKSASTSGLVNSDESRSNSEDQPVSESLLLPCSDGNKAEIKAHSRDEISFHGQLIFQEPEETLEPPKELEISNTSETLNKSGVSVISEPPFESEDSDSKQSVQTDEMSFDSAPISQRNSIAGLEHLTLTTEIDDNSSQHSFGSSTDLLSDDQNLPDWVKINESVLVRPSNYSGSISFIGYTQFAPGLWIGVDLDSPSGKNDGSVNNVRYFTCRPRHGLFVRPEKLQLKRSNVGHQQGILAASKSTSQDALGSGANNFGKLRRQNKRSSLSKSSTDLYNNQLQKNKQEASNKGKYRKSASHMK